MKVALIDVKGRDNRSIDKNSAVNIRNMNILAYELGAKFFFNANQLLNSKNDFDIIIFGFGSIASNINEVRDFCSQNKKCKYYWLVGEYEQSMSPSLYYACKENGLKFETIQNFDIGVKNFGKMCGANHFLNINLLISKKPKSNLKKKYDICYYSRWRPNRSKYLKKYLKERVYLSTDSKNFKQHKHIGCNPKYIKKLSWIEGRETLSLFRYSLYIEDEFTHSNFNNLANRWYEAGFCNNVVFFDKSCINTIRKSEIGKHIEEIKFYIVDSYSELCEKMDECNENFDFHLQKQIEWRKSEYDDKKDVLNKIKEIISC